MTVAEMLDKAINTGESGRVDGICMDKLVSWLEENGFVAITELDSNGWDADFSQTFYSESMKKFFNASASGYYGYGSLTVLDDEEVISELNDEDIERIEDAGLDSILNRVDFKSQQNVVMEQLKVEDELYKANLERFDKLNAKLQGLLGGLSESSK